MKATDLKLRTHPEAWIRAFDILVSTSVVILLSPVYAVLGLAVLICEGPPIFYRQERIGRNGKAFFILKFRSMKTGPRGPMITAQNDPRVTRLGAWLRRYKLDELPQFVNVIRGEMSLIGPRPEVRKYVDLQGPVWKQVLQYRPGITDLASLVFRDEETVLGQAAEPEDLYRSVILPAKLDLNRKYQKIRSFKTDLILIWLSARYGFAPSGFHPDRIARAVGVELPAIFLNEETTNHASASIHSVPPAVHR